VRELTDLRAGLERKQWIQLREATYIAYLALNYLAVRPPTTSWRVASAEARRALDMMTRVLGRSWDGRGVWLDPSLPPPGPEVYDQAEPPARPDSFGAWMARRRDRRVEVTGEALQAEWERQLAEDSFLSRLDGNEADAVLDLLTAAWQRSAAVQLAVGDHEPG
jgi:hypothetical protein